MASCFQVESRSSCADDSSSVVPREGIPTIDCYSVRCWVVRYSTPAKTRISQRNGQFSADRAAADSAWLTAFAYPCIPQPPAEYRNFRNFSSGVSPKTRHTSTMAASLLHSMLSLSGEALTDIGSYMQAVIDGGCSDVDDVTALLESQLAAYGVDADAGKVAEAAAALVRAPAESTKPAVAAAQSPAKLKQTVVINSGPIAATAAAERST